MIKNILLGFVAAVTLVACVTVASKQPVNLSNQQLAEIKSVVSYGLIDPDSAQFREIVAYDAVMSDGSASRFVCGQVNARNRMGGYAGFSYFRGHYVEGKFVLQMLDGINESIAMWSCNS
ncbi:hypothetical protein [Ketogulonicigenium vulgare]|uniref:hypothetical protein n=1 Tax=Ketogulonicigenium vulgare TaxID=92945 RepID=UPI00235A0E83|nr:hypothetical protein [Ketogulonicigenium vulgare]